MTSLSGLETENLKRFKRLRVTGAIASMLGFAQLALCAPCTRAGDTLSGMISHSDALTRIRVGWAGRRGATAKLASCVGHSRWRERARARAHVAQCAVCDRCGVCRRRQVFRLCAAGTAL